jgi:hypothetical protein
MRRTRQNRPPRPRPGDRIRHPRGASSLKRAISESIGARSGHPCRISAPLSSICETKLGFPKLTPTLARGSDPVATYSSRLRSKRFATRTLGLRRTAVGRDVAPSRGEFPQKDRVRLAGGPAWSCICTQRDLTRRSSSTLKRASVPLSRHRLDPAGLERRLGDH